MTRLEDDALDELVADDDPDVISGMARLAKLRASEDEIPDLNPR